MKEHAMMFSGGVDTTLAAARLLETGEVDRLHLLTFCNGLCVGVNRSEVHARELRQQFGDDRIRHEVMYVTELFEEVRSPLKELVRHYRSTLVFDLCCRLSMETRAIQYALDNDLDAIADGTNIDQGKLFLERPEYMDVVREYFGSFGIRYYSPVYARSGGRRGRWEEMVRRGFSIGPLALEYVNVNACLMYQPFCLMGIHTFFFTSFMRKAPVLGRVIRKVNLPLHRAIDCRTGRQQIARDWIERNRAFHEVAEDDEMVVGGNFCTTRLCGQNSVELTFPRGTSIDVEGLASLWQDQGEVGREGGIVQLRSNGVLLRAYPNGRVVVRGTKNREKAEDLFERYVAPHDVFARDAAG